MTGDGIVEDSLPEDQALVVRTGNGLTVLTGCGHAGTGNILAFARALHADAPVRAVLGGLHLLGAHCTGLEAVYRLRALAGLTRETAVVGAVASR